MRMKRPNEMSQSQTREAVCPTSAVMTSRGFSTSILKISSTSECHFPPSAKIPTHFHPSNFSLEKTTRYWKQISTGTERKIVKPKGIRKLKTDNPELDKIVDNIQGNLLKVRQIVKPEMRNRWNEGIKDFEQNCTDLTLENNKVLKNKNIEDKKLSCLHPQARKVLESKRNFGFRRTNPCNCNSQKNNLESPICKSIPCGLNLDNPIRGVIPTHIKDNSKQEEASTFIFTDFPVSKTKDEVSTTPNANKGSISFIVSLSAPMTFASQIISHETGDQQMPLPASLSPHITEPPTSNIRNSSAMSHLSSSNHRVSLAAKKGKFGPLTRTFLSALFTLLTAIPAFAKGSDEASITSNLFGGFSRLSFEQQLFLQDNHTTTKAQSGATAALHCALSAPLADGLVSWVRRRDYHLLTVGRQVYSSDQRVGIKVSPDGSDWVLTIRWVSSHDAGQYECQVSSHPPQALMINLSVVEAHAEILGGKERYIHSGSSLRLVCLLREATESPVYVFWYRGDRMINYDKEQGVRVDNSREASVLYVTSVTGRDEGNYTCLPSNASPASVTVHVVHKENPAHLQQETNTEKESNPSSSSASAPSSSLTSLKSAPASTSSSSTYLTNCCSHLSLKFLTMMSMYSVSFFIKKLVEQR